MRALAASFVCENTRASIGIGGASGVERADWKVRTTCPGGGFAPCFIATAAYGSPLAPEVDALRTLRDRFLMRTAWGRAFVRAYYFVSPALASVIAKSGALKYWARVAFLRPMIFLLRSFAGDERV